MLMTRISIIAFLFLSLVSCKKEPADFIWEKSFGTGCAYFVGSTADSGILACGTMNDNPYLIKLSREKKTIVEYTSPYSGAFISAWSDDSCFIAAGIRNGKMLLECIDNSGTGKWDTTFTSAFEIGLTRLYHYGNGDFLALGSPCPDSVSSAAAGLLLVRFDTTGSIILKKEITDKYFIASGTMAVDNSGNIFLPLTRKSGSAKAKASVAKYNSDFQRIWETELYNNPDFGAVCTAVTMDNQGMIYMTGKTEVSRQEGILDNSFVASMNSSGTVRWKNYLEFDNTGSALLFDDDVLMILNRNCFVINRVKPDDGSDDGILRMLSVCNSKSTNAFGYSMDIDPDGNILTSGERAKTFYVALKASVK